MSTVPIGRTKPHSMDHTISRRQWCKHIATLTIGGLIAPELYAWRGTENPVIGIQTYSLRDRSLTDAIAAMVTLGIRDCELWSGHIEPEEYRWQRGLSASKLRESQQQLHKWRKNLRMDTIRSIRQQFDRAGIRILAYNANFKDNASDFEIDQGFRIAQTLGTNTLNSSATVSIMGRLDRYAQQYRIRVGMHNHANVDKPNEFATPDSFSRGMAGKSSYIGINLDTGHFTAANFDPLAYLKENHRHIFSIHLKDRKKNQGIRTPFGEGDTPLAAMLRLINKNGWSIPAFIEYEYEGMDTMVELRKCLDFCHRVLGTNGTNETK